ncbi:MAG: hypothetical protein ACI8XC_004153, partial [Gammaproteobacteria bacterium]
KNFAPSVIGRCDWIRIAIAFEGGQKTSEIYQLAWFTLPF